MKTLEPGKPSNNVSKGRVAPRPKIMGGLSACQARCSRVVQPYPYTMTFEDAGCNFVQSEILAPGQ